MPKHRLTNRAPRPHATPPPTPTPCQTPLTSPRPMHSMRKRKLGTPNKKKERDKKGRERARHARPFERAHGAASEKSTGEITHKTEPTRDKSKQQGTNRSNKGQIEATRVQSSQPRAEESHKGLIPHVIPPAVRASGPPAPPPPLAAGHARPPRAPCPTRLCQGRTWDKGRARMGGQEGSARWCPPWQAPLPP